MFTFGSFFVSRLEQDVSNCFFFFLNMQCRMYYYVTMTALRDNETQMKGVVCIMYLLGQKKFLSNRPEKIGSIWDHFPVRLAAMHFCYDSILLKGIVEGACKAMEGNKLCRTRSHFGMSSICYSILIR